MRTRLPLLLIVTVGTIAMAAGCDVEKQMDSMVDNPSFAGPLFAKFMGRAEYQAKAMDTILADAAMRQMLLDKLMANPDYVRAAAEKILASEEARAMVAELMAQGPKEQATGGGAP